MLGAVPREIGQFHKFAMNDPLLSSANAQTLHMISGIPGMVQPLQNILRTLPSVTGLTAPLQSALNRDAQIVATGGRMTPSEAASLNAPLTAELGQAGMGHTAPGVFTQGMNTYQEMQNRVNTAIGQEMQLAPGIEQLRTMDVGLRTALPQAIVGLQGTGIETALGTEASRLGDYTSLAGMFAPSISSAALANQQAGAASSIAGANKNAGLETGAVSALGSIGAAAIAA